MIGGTLGLLDKVNGHLLWRCLGCLQAREAQEPRNLPLVHANHDCLTILIRRNAKPQERRNCQCAGPRDSLAQGSGQEWADMSVLWTEFVYDKNPDEPFGAPSHYIFFARTQWY